MIFGKTAKEVAEENSNNDKKLIFGIKKFAWTPVDLTDGRKVWLSHYYLYQSGKVNKEGVFESHGQFRRYLERSMNFVLLVNYRFDNVNIDELEKMMGDK